jgi:ABC-type uncharacterized transport system substrate-binding protein
MQRAFLSLAQAALLATLILFVAGPARAHPHVWLTVHTEVLFDHGTVSGVRHAWTFDEFYTAMAIEGLDANKDGRYDRQELAELAKVNMDGLKEFEYFTLAKLKESRLAFLPAEDYWLEHANGLLTLHFALPLAKPVAPDAAGLTISVFDPSYFIAFAFAKDNPVKAAGASADCKAALKSSDASEKGALGAGAGSNTIEVVCGK